MSTTTAAAADDSRRLAQQIRTLKELTLPDEWYSAGGTSLRERFASTARALRARDPKSTATADSLLADFDNGGHPFVHTVWLNQPLFCPKCRSAGADGTYTVVSIREGEVIAIPAAELHDVEAHGGGFSPESLRHLKRVFSHP